jgi:superfamily I DNA/RNA helicase
LVSFLQGISGDVLNNVDVRNYHHFALGYLASRGYDMDDAICDSRQRALLCQQALQEAVAGGSMRRILQRPVDFIVEEIRWIEQHGIRSVDEYEEAERVGQGTRVQRADRQAVFDVYRRYLDLRKVAGRPYDWDDLASYVLDELTEDRDDRLYRHIVIDEGQDFSPMMLRSLARAIPASGSLTFFGDMAQQIYGNRMSWRSAGLSVPKAWRFEENYRNSRQIAALAIAIASMPFFRGYPDLIEPVAPTADGPLPVVIQFEHKDDERRFVVDRAVKEAATKTVAILFRDREQEGLVRPFLPASARRLHRELKLWPAGPGLFYGTYHAAKGLEFDAVFIPFLSEPLLPRQKDIEAFGAQEAQAIDGRLLYVAATRARLDLVLTHAGSPSLLLPTNEELYRRMRR